MEYLKNGFTLDCAGSSFPLSTDSMVLSGFVKLPRNAKVLDLGSGCGTLGVLLCAGDASCTVTGIEINNQAHLAAMENIRRNEIPGRLSSICADLKSVPTFVRAGAYDVCVSNPPYFSGGPASKTQATARREDSCAPEDLFRAAAWALRYGGDFFLVHRPERLAQLCACANQAGLEAKRLCLVRHRQGSDVALILLQCRKGGKPGLILEELCLFDDRGNPTEEYRRLYNL